MMNEALKALNRFGLGARVGERRRIGDPGVWLRSQLDPARARLDAAGLPSLKGIGSALQQLRQAQNGGDQAARSTARRKIQEIAISEGTTVLGHRFVTDAPFLERLVAFWSNHLCVSFEGKLGVVALAGHYEREAIRPHVLGRFSDMVLASARHPAMLLYLDNVRSIGPSSRGSRFAARRGRERGLNENYARELLELHTLGVNGGYTQADVEQLALIFTGWTLAGFIPRSTNATEPRFTFHPLLHEPGEKTVLGVRYREEGVSEGEKVIRDLCRRPATARFVAEKLVRHFVADTPPAPAVERIARMFRETDGDLLQVSRALIDLKEAWDPAYRKFRTPQEWLVAAFRAVGFSSAPPQVGTVLRQLRHALWAPPSPKGYGDSIQEWADPDSLMNRAELARTVSKRLSTRRVDPEWILEAVDVPGSDPLRTLLVDASIGRADRLALGIAGPAFQWR